MWMRFCVELCHAQWLESSMIDLFKPTPRFQDGFLCNLALNLRGATANCHCFDFLIGSTLFTFCSKFPEFTTLQTKLCICDYSVWLPVQLLVTVPLIRSPTLRITPLSKAIRISSSLIRKTRNPFKNTKTPSSSLLFWGKAT